MKGGDGDVLGLIRVTLINATTFVTLVLVGYVFGSASVVEQVDAQIADNCEEFEIWQGNDNNNVRYDNAQMGYNSNLWNGKAGADDLYGQRCAEAGISGGDGHDDIFLDVNAPQSSFIEQGNGGGHNDIIDGGPGTDEFWGDGGDDTLLDRSAGTDDDTLHGGDGGDLLDARDNDAIDSLEGGPGSDFCYGEPNDSKTSCETT